ncbi:hypothetical protein ACFXHA_11380 [Nocardia sp. NPDC059240]|uniref:hypothetical protein n=1 Tax=Nocardia sp. NPDC059240 TaxID=3346786 RepID=UPI0036B999AC
MKIDPDSLTSAAVNIGELGEAVKDTAVFPPLNAQRGVDALKGSKIAAALGGSLFAMKADDVGAQAMNVLASRYAGFAGLLEQAAVTFADTDTELAAQFKGLVDLNASEV